VKPSRGLPKFRPYANEVCKKSDWLRMIYKQDKNEYNSIVPKLQKQIGLDVVLEHSALRACLQAFMVKKKEVNALNFLMNVKTWRAIPTEKATQRAADACSIVKKYVVESGTHQVQEFFLRFIIEYGIIYLFNFIRSTLPGKFVRRLQTHCRVSVAPNLLRETLTLPYLTKPLMISQQWLGVICANLSSIRRRPNVMRWPQSMRLKANTALSEICTV
jgi:hypothetical protein